EVGTTNRTHGADYERAIGAETAVLLRVHQSNFRVVGFEERPRLEEVAAVAQRHGLPLVDDLGSGAIAPVEAEPTARESLVAGAGGRGRGDPRARRRRGAAARRAAELCLRARGVARAAAQSLRSARRRRGARRPPPARLPDADRRRGRRGRTPGRRRPRLTEL